VFNLCWITLKKPKSCLNGKSCLLWLFQAHNLSATRYRYLEQLNAYTLSRQPCALGPTSLRPTFRSSTKSIVWLCCMIVLFSGCSSPHTQKTSGLSTTPKLHESSFSADDGYILPLKRYWPESVPNAIVIALHGFNDYSNAFKGMCEYLVIQNIACLAYDQRGFGGTEERGIWPEKGRLQADFAAVVLAVNKRYEQMPIYVVGESMGGAVILTALAEGDARLASMIEGSVLLAPAVWARDTQPWYQRWLLWMAVHTLPAWSPTGEGLGVQASDNIAALRAMGRDELVIKETRIDAVYGLTNLMDQALESTTEVTIPTLVLYGERDEVIPKLPSCTMLNRMEQSQAPVDFRLYKNGYHMLTRDLQAELVFEDLVSWIRGERFVLKESGYYPFCF